MESSTGFLQEIVRRRLGFQQAMHTGLAMHLGEPSLHPTCWVGLGAVPPLSRNQGAFIHTTLGRLLPSSQESFMCLVPSLVSWAFGSHPLRPLHSTYPVRTSCRL